MMPVGLADRIAEPLVGDFVCDEAFVAGSRRSGAVAEDVFSIKDAAGVLHAPEAGLRLDIGQLGVREGPQAAFEKLDNAPCLGQVAESCPAVFRVGPALNGNLASRRVKVLDGKSGHPDHHHLGGQGRRGTPVSAAPSARQAGLLLQCAVGHHLVVIRRRDDKLAGGLVIGMVDDRKPMAGPVGPVVAKEGPLAVLVVGDDQPIAGHAPVVHLKAPLSACLSRLLQLNRQALSTVGESAGSAFLLDGGHCHPLGGADLMPYQIEMQDLAGRGQELHRQQGPAHDLVTVVAELKLEAVMQDVDRRLARIRIRCAKAMG